MNPRAQAELQTTLLRIDGRGYKAYGDIRGTWLLGDFVLRIDHVQGDPFASPSRVRAFLDPTFAGLPAEACQNESRAVGTACLLARRFATAASRVPAGPGTGRSGEVRMEAPGQEVLPQTAVLVHADGSVEARFTVGLPASGRRVLGEAAVRLLLDTVPSLIRRTLRIEAGDAAEILLHAETNEDADALRETLAGMELVAFVADGAVLPRRSGITQEPMTGPAVVPFRSPDSLRVEVRLPNAGALTGMGIPRGVTLIVGGGYHGKSTLLRALERGVYNHRPGDGRDRTVSHPGTVKIRSEDGRSVKGVDISPFIRNLPLGEDTSTFSTPNASGSTSQAANIMEAVEVGASALLIDEDTAATNFMIRDRRMQALIPRDDEPITPYIDRARQLFEELGVSSILVLGGSGDYLDVADLVVAMKAYSPEDVTEEAREVADAHPTGRQKESTGPMAALPLRVPHPSSVDPRKGRREESLRLRGSARFSLGREELDLTGVEQILSSTQTRAIGLGVLLAWRDYMDDERSLPEILDQVEKAVEVGGLDVLDPRCSGDLSAFRRFELAAALNRLRTLEVRAGKGS
jgi:predicted ABC-class ATPase